ncbi:MAG: DUF6580 family putative transport protein [Chitinophagaceae bacterium]
MTKQTFNPKTGVLLIIILLTGIMRIPNATQITPWSNFSAIGAMALFGGTYFNKPWKAFLFPVLTLLLSDLAISLFIFHGKYGIIYGGWYWIYGIFLLIVLLGRWIISKVTVTNVVIASVSAALLHWLLADLTVWIGGGTDLRTMQPLSRDINGLIQCYTQGFPFMKNFLAGTLLYSGIMFGVFELMKMYNPKLVLAFDKNNEK